MSGRWQCSRTKEIYDLIYEMACEMYLRDWKRGMRNAHWVIQAFHRKDNI